MSRGDHERRVPDPDQHRGIGRAFRTVYPPEKAAIQQFDQLIDKLGQVPPTGPAAGDQSTH